MILHRLFIFCLFFWIAFACRSTAQAELLGVGVPYLPERLQLVGSNDIINEIILRQVSCRPISFQGNSIHAVNVTQELKGTKRQWTYQFKLPFPLDNKLNASESNVADSLKFFIEKAKGDKDELMAQPIKTALMSIDDIRTKANPDGFDLMLSATSPPPLTTEALASLPFIDHKVASLFGEALGRGTNIPTYGKFTVTECQPKKHCSMVRNAHFGTYDPEDLVDSIKFAVFESSKSRMTAIRSGFVRLIILPTETELLDAATDPTLEIIPITLNTLNMELFESQAPKKSHFRQENFIPKKAIIRRGLNISREFSENLELSDLIRSNP